jgi:hypothetical protein
MAALGAPPAFGAASDAQEPEPVAEADLAEFEGVARRTAELRGLVPRQTVPIRLLSPEQFQARLVARLSAPAAQERLERRRRALVAFGLLAPTADLVALELERRIETTFGEYDPETGQVYLVLHEAAIGPLERVSFAHFYTYALVDQHYGLRALLPEASDNADRDLAVETLLNVDARTVAAMYRQYALTRAEREAQRSEVNALDDAARLGDLPLVLRDMAYFPYLEGSHFVLAVLGVAELREALLAGEGYGEQVEPLYARLPTASAQIIHPEQYLDAAAPVEVPLPDLIPTLGGGWTDLGRDVLGELDHRVLVQQFLGRTAGAVAAAGWAGNRYAVFARGTDSAVVVRTRWTTALEAAEWLEAYARAVQVRHGEAAVASDPSGDWLTWRTPDGLQAIRLANTTTDLLLAPDPATLRALQTALPPAP